jgi:hypothetical protein
MAWMYLRDRILPDWPWYAWALFAWSSWEIFPLFTSVALRGRIPSTQTLSQG